MVKKKKGFTLVELLATITIMGLITVMVTPSIVKLQNNNKTKQFEMYAKSLVEAAKVYVQKEGEDRKIPVNISDSNYIIDNVQ